MLKAHFFMLFSCFFVLLVYNVIEIGGRKMSNKSVFADNLKRYMDLNNKSRKDVCEALNFSYYTFSDWVNGKKYPRMDKVEILANYFGIKKSDLIEEPTKKIKMDNTYPQPVNIKSLLDKYHVTLNELSAELGISTAELVLYQNGKEMPFKLVQKMADYFKVDVADLYGVSMFEKGNTAFVSTSKRAVELHEKWNKEVGELDFSNKEHDLLVSCANFIKETREKKNHDQLLDMAFMMINQLKK